MNQEFPGQHTTTTTVTSTSTTTQSNIRFDSSYVKTLPGLLKVIQMVLNILGFISITVSKYSSSSRGGWFNVVAMGGFWVTGVLLVFYLFHIIEKLARIPWLKLEFIFCSLWAVFYLIAAALAADYGRYTESFAVAAFFGFCAMLVYGYDAWLKFSAARSGTVAQGQQHTVKQVSTVTTTGY